VNELYLVMSQQISWVKVGLVCSKNSYSKHCSVLTMCYFGEWVTFIAEHFKWSYLPMIVCILIQTL